MNLHPHSYPANLQNPENLDSDHNPANPQNPENPDSDSERNPTFFLTADSQQLTAN